MPAARPRPWPARESKTPFRVQLRRLLTREIIGDCGDGEPPSYRRADRKWNPSLLESTAQARPLVLARGPMRPPWHASPASLQLDGAFNQSVEAARIFDGPPNHQQLIVNRERLRVVSSLDGL